MLIYARDTMEILSTEANTSSADIAACNEDELAKIS